MKFISIVSTGKDKRVSTLQVTKTGLCVLGNLPHGYEFKMKTAKDKAKLQTWLRSQCKRS